MVDFQRLLTFARELQRARSFGELMPLVQRELAETTGYVHVWFFVAETGTTRWRYIGGDSSVDSLIWENAPILEAKDDAMLIEIASSHQPVIVVDARTDPRTDKKMVEAFQNRTIVNVPMSLGAEQIGTMGFGTYGDEGVRAPEREDIEEAQAIAAQVTVAVARLRFEEEQAATRRERERMRERIEAASRLESLGQLAGGIAHDFNNLLTVILNDAHFIGEGTLSEEQRKDIGTLVQAAGLAQRLTRQLLALSRRQILHVAVLDLGQQLRALVGLLRRLIPENITVEFSGEAGPFPVLADATQLDQLFMNLCVNARDAMLNGGRLEITARIATLAGDEVPGAELAPGDFVEVTVRDTGKGMPPEIARHVFEPFYTTKQEGTGLGLAVAWGVARQHRGAITCYSEAGRGTRFRVLLPLNEAPVGRPATAPVAEIDAGSPSAGLRILAAEDEESLRRILSRILVRAGYTVDLAVDGQDAVTRASEVRYDLVILDMVMPRMNGKEAWKRIREMRPEMPFLFTSGYSTEDLDDASVRVLDKPYGQAALLEAVREALGRRSAD